MDMLKKNNGFAERNPTKTFEIPERQNLSPPPSPALSTTLSLQVLSIQVNPILPEDILAPFSLERKRC